MMMVVRGSSRTKINYCCWLVLWLVVSIIREMVFFRASSILLLDDEKSSEAEEKGRLLSLWLRPRRRRPWSVAGRRGCQHPQAPRSWPDALRPRPAPAPRFPLLGVPERPRPRSPHRRCPRALRPGTGGTAGVSSGPGPSLPPAAPPRRTGRPRRRRRRPAPPGQRWGPGSAAAWPRGGRARAPGRGRRPPRAGGWRGRRRTWPARGRARCPGRPAPAGAAPGCR
mmetsp:Transcript_44197/g.69151  ORF Transcript_44197/g.69151 Transcript_44197/m.69151 type:complete len:225 (+) Transcript_44197:243-917(+)